MPRQETTITFGPWAPDFPAYGGAKLLEGGVVLCEDAKGVYPTLGGYRPLIKPGTAIGAFTDADFPELFTPNTMPASAEADIWLDDLDPATITHVPNSFTSNFITGWNNKITGATDNATFVYQYPSLTNYYISLQYLNIGGGDYGAWAGGQGLQVGGAMDIDLSATHTGTTLWCLILATDHNFGTGSYNLTGNILVEFGNDGEVASENADSAVIVRDGTNRAVAASRNGETNAVGATFTTDTEFITFAIFDGSNKVIRSNGTQIDSETSTAAFDISRIRLGGPGDLGDDLTSSNPDVDFTWWGAIREVVVGTGPITSTDIEKLEGWLAHKRGLTSLLPSGHAYKTEPPETAGSAGGANEPTSHGLFWSRQGSPYFFIGDYEKIWLLNQSSVTFDDVSNASTAYLATRDLPWQFSQFGNRVIAVTKNTAPQYYDLGTSALFADLPGSPPKARAIGVAGEFVMLGSVTETDGNLYEYRVRWCAFNDSEDWTTDPGGTQADFQDLDSQYGEVMAIVGGEYFTVFQQRAITRFTYVGGNVVFQRDTVEINRGTIAPHSVIRIGGLIFYYAHDGFWAFDGRGSQRISGDQIHRWVENRLSESTAQEMRVDYDPDRRIIMWAWPYDPDGAGRKTSGLQLIYNYESGQWSYNIDTQLRWWIVRGPPVVDYIDGSSALIDDSSALIDSEQTEFARTLAMNYDGELWRVSALDGGDVPATLETVKIAMTPGRRSFVTSGRIIGNIDETSAIVIAIESETGFPSNALASATGADEYSYHTIQDGFFPARSNGRFHGVMVRWDGGKGDTDGDLEELDVVQGVTLEYRGGGRF